MATTGTPRRPARPAGGGSRGPTTPPPSRKSNGTRRPRRRRPTVWNKLATAFQWVTLILLIAFITLMAGLLYQINKAPQTIDLSFNPPSRTLIYSSDGVVLARLYTENRQVVSIDQIPKDLQHATIAFEDKRFYTHSGIDFWGIGRALVRDFQHGDKSEGASTITQQLARTLGVNGLTREKTFKRKLRELIVANQIEKSYTKQRILEMYLNEVNYGSGAYGVEAAAQTYFGKDVKDLDLAQCALLAGLPNRPAYYSPYKDKDAARQQRSIVLDTMLAQHYITPEQCDQAKNEKVILAASHPPSSGNQIIHAPYFVNSVIDQLKQKYGEDYIDRGNLKVYTTLNWQMQQIAEDALRTHIDEVRGRGPTQGCLVALDPRTGQIKAMVGGVDYKKTQFNIVTQSQRQPGSTFKAVVYSAAIDSGLVTENTTVLDARISYPMVAGKDYTPKDDDGYSNRRMNLRAAMAYSVNVVAVKVLKLIGPETAIRYARMMGIKSHLDPVLSLALGSSAVTPLEMAGVYGTIAAGGRYAVPTEITRLTDLDGKVINENPPQVATHVLSADTVRQVDDMLRAVVTEPRGTGHGVSDVPDARGKTGTTQGHKDVWFDGYDKNLVCVVWAGHPIRNKNGTYAYGETMAGNAWGATVCAPIWKNFMLKASPIYQKAVAKSMPKPTPTPKPPDAPTTNLDNAAPNFTSGNQTAAPTDTSAPPASNGGVGAGAQSRPSAQPAPTIIDVQGGTERAGDTVSVNVDSSTGLRAPPGAPHSHLENFPRGAAPTVLSPQYDRPADLAGPQNARTPVTQTPPPPTIDTPPVAAMRPAARPRPRGIPAPPKPQKPPVEYVTVRINPDDGLLANKWTPEYVEKTFVKGQQPHRYTHEFGPPPGEH